jgi:hypothetical protein
MELKLERKFSSLSKKDLRKRWTPFPSGYGHFGCDTQEWESQLIASLRMKILCG